VVRLLPAVPHPKILGAHPQHPRESHPRIGPCRASAFDQLIWPVGVSLEHTRSRTAV
jgi:hypothetical protein